MFNAECEVPCTEETKPTIDYNHTFQNLFNNSGPNKGVGLNINILLRNRQAQSAQARSMLEYRQAQLQLQQIYLKVRMQVINGQYALTNDRALVQSAQAAADYNRKSLDYEEKKIYISERRSLRMCIFNSAISSNAENNLITARATYAKDQGRVDGDSQQHAGPLWHQLEEAVTGNVTKIPVIPGLGG